jgi:hypothetical protein
MVEEEVLKVARRCEGLRNAVTASDDDRGPERLGALRRCEREVAKAPQALDLQVTNRLPDRWPYFFQPGPLVALVFGELARGQLTEGEQTALRAYLPLDYLSAPRACKERAFAGKPMRGRDPDLDRCVADAEATLWTRVATAACEHNDGRSARSALAHVAGSDVPRLVERCRESGVELSAH